MPRQWKYGRLQVATGRIDELVTPEQYTAKQWLGVMAGWNRDPRWIYFPIWEQGDSPYEN